VEVGRRLGVPGTWTASDVPDLAFDAVIDCSTAAALPGLAVDIVEPGKRVVYIGLASTPSLVDTRTMVLKDVTAVGILSASPGLAATIEHYASGSVDPTPLVCATVGLSEVGSVLAGWRPAGAGPGPKVHVDPRRGRLPGTGYGNGRWRAGCCPCDGPRSPGTCWPASPWPRWVSQKSSGTPRSPE